MAGQLTILVVEDDADCAQVLGEAFEIEGHRVIVANSAAEVRRVLVVERPDVVIMDVRIGQDDGIVLTRALRGGPLAGVPVILTTGRSHAEVAIAAREAGIERVLVKPIDLAVLLDAVVRAASRRADAPRTGS